MKFKKADHKFPTYNGTKYTLPFQKNGRGHNEEILDQSKTQIQLGKLQTLHLHVCCQCAPQIYNLFQLH